MKKPQLFPAFELLDALAIKAVSEGEADEVAQKRALDWIVKGIARVRDLSYDPESSHATAFAEGRRSVGLEIALYMTMSPRDLEKLALQRKGKRGE